MDSVNLLQQVEAKIKEKLNSSEYQKVKIYENSWIRKNVKTDQEKESVRDWQVLRDELDLLRRDEVFYQQSILSQKVPRKRYTHMDAVISERTGLNTIAEQLYREYDFAKYSQNPGFGDVILATGFKEYDDVYTYFKNRDPEAPKEIRDEFDISTWLYLLRLHTHVNNELDSTFEVYNGNITVILEKGWKSDFWRNWLTRVKKVPVEIHEESF